MDVQTCIDTALTASATTLAAGEAANSFRETFNNSHKVRVNLTMSQRADLMDMLTFQPIFMGGMTITNDHPVLVALRNLARDIFEAEFKISSTRERTLVIGAAAREIKKYNNNPNIHYYVHGGENKDYDRIIRPALNDISNNLRLKASKKNRKIFLPRLEEQDRIEKRGIVKRYDNIVRVLRDYVELNRMPDNIHVEPVEANTLLFEDSFYNFSESDYVELFEKTGANVAYGYGLLPNELLFSDLPANNIYAFTNFGNFSNLTFRNGYCNGYEHRTSDWATLLKRPAIMSGNTTLAVEITCRMGPMAVFKIYRCRHPERICRRIELPASQDYVRLLDVLGSCDKKTGKVKNPLKYFSVNADEFFQTYNYLSSVAEKSQTMETAMTFVRRRMGGISLVTKELVKRWQLPGSDVQKFCLTVLLYVRIGREDTEAILKNIKPQTAADKLKETMGKIVYYTFYPISLLIEWLISADLGRQLIIFPTTSVEQRLKVRVSSDCERTDCDVGLYCDNENEEQIGACDFCNQCSGKMGEQKIFCKPGEDEVVISLTDKEVSEMRASLIDNDNDPVGLKKVKEKCLKSMPKKGFSIKIKVNYIKAGPGCGKSYLIRKLADKNDLVMAPFAKLKPDYENIEHADGEGVYDLLFKTTHRSMESRGSSRVFLDEFTSMPYEYLACVCYLNGAKEVFLVGDDRQTKVIDGQEGIYIGKRINLDKITTHELLVNFRNPRDTVALLNRVYGYRMEAKSSIVRSIEVKLVGEVAVDSGIVMAFTKASAKHHTEEEKNTVRANQGGTSKEVVLYLTNNDGTTAKVTCLQIVALSRHTEKLTILHDNCEIAQQVIGSLSLTEEFYNTMETYIPKHNLADPADVIEPKYLEEILNNDDYQKPYDKKRVRIDGVGTRIKEFVEFVEEDVFGAFKKFKRIVVAAAKPNLKDKLRGLLPGTSRVVDCEAVDEGLAIFSSLLDDAKMSVSDNEKQCWKEIFKFLLFLKENALGCSPSITCSVVRPEELKECGANIIVNIVRVSKDESRLDNHNKRTKELLDSSFNKALDKFKESESGFSFCFTRVKGKEHQSVFSVFVNPDKRTTELLPPLDILFDGAAKAIDFSGYSVLFDTENLLSKQKSSRALADVLAALHLMKTKHFIVNRTEDFTMHVAQRMVAEKQAGQDTPISTVESNEITAERGVTTEVRTLSSICEEVTASTSNELKEKTESAIVDTTETKPLTLEQLKTDILPDSILKGLDKFKKHRLSTRSLNVFNVYSEETECSEDDFSSKRCESFPDFKSFVCNDVLSDNFPVLRDILPISNLVKYKGRMPLEKISISGRKLEFAENIIHLIHDNPEKGYKGFAEVIMKDHGAKDYVKFVNDAKRKKELSFGHIVMTSGKRFENVVNIVSNKESCLVDLEVSLKALFKFIKDKPVVFSIPAVCCGLWEREIEEVLQILDRCLRDKVNIKLRMYVPDEETFERACKEMARLYPLFVGPDRKPGLDDLIDALKEKFGAIDNSRLPIIPNARQRVQSLKQLPSDSDYVVVSKEETTSLDKFTSAGFVLQLTELNPVEPSCSKIIREEIELREQDKPTHPPKDAYKFLFDLVPNVAVQPELTSLNQQTSVVVQDNFASGTVCPDNIVLPVNKRFHPQTINEQYYSIGCGVGNYFTGKNPMQTVAVLGARYLNKIETYEFEETAKSLAEEVVDLWFSEHVQPDMNVTSMDDPEISDIIAGFLRNITQKNYQEAFEGTGGIDNPDGRVIRFELKGIFKPKTGIPDFYKAGQGISAWSTDACSMFCGVFRILTKAVSKTEKPHVITDAYMDELAFINLVNASFETTPAVALNAVTDADTFDANQNRFTQEIERTYWRRMGVCETFLDLYYSFRVNYQIVSNVATGKCKTQKTSGEPGTLVNNGIVSKTISNFLVRGEGPMVVIYKGDDFCKRQCNLKTNEDNMRRINGACPLKLRIAIADGAEFCGLVYSNKTLYPSIPRKVNKAIAHRFRDYHHFTEYQAALRDWTDRINTMDEKRVVAFNANQFGTTLEEMYMAYWAIVSLSHIREDQFYELVKERKTEWSLLPRMVAGKTIVDME